MKILQEKHRSYIGGSVRAKFFIFILFYFFVSLESKSREDELMSTEGSCQIWIVGITNA